MPFLRLCLMNSTNCLDVYNGDFFMKTIKHDEQHLHSSHNNILRYLSFR